MPTAMSILYCKTSWNKGVFFIYITTPAHGTDLFNFMSWSFFTLHNRLWIFSTGKTDFFFLDLSMVSRASCSAQFSIGFGNVFPTRSAMSCRKLNIINLYTAPIDTNAKKLTCIVCGDGFAHSIASNRRQRLST